MQKRARAGAHQSFSDRMVVGRLATVRHFEAQGKREETVLFWSVVAAPDRQVFVGASVVDTVPLSIAGNYQPGGRRSRLRELFLRARAIAHQNQTASGESAGKDYDRLSTLWYTNDGDF